MKFLVLLPLVALVGCSAQDDTLCRKRVKERFANVDVVQISRWHFIVRDTLGNIIYAETMNSADNEVSAFDTIMKPLPRRCH